MLERHEIKVFMRRVGSCNKYMIVRNLRLLSVIHSYLEIIKSQNVTGLFILLFLECHIDSRHGKCHPK